MANVIVYSLHSKLKLCKHHYISDNVDKNFQGLVKELKQQLLLGNEIVLTKMIGKDAVNLLKLVSDGQ